MHLNNSLCILNPLKHIEFFSLFFLPEVFLIHFASADNDLTSLDLKISGKSGKFDLP